MAERDEGSAVPHNLSAPEPASDYFEQDSDNMHWSSLRDDQILANADRIADAWLGEGSGSPVDSGEEQQEIDLSGISQEDLTEALNGLFPSKDES